MITADRDVDEILAYFAEDAPVAGVFEIEGGKIKDWRDYFDMAAWTR